MASVSPLRYAGAIRQVMRDAKLSGSELEELVHQRMRTVLESAYLQVPYYRQLMGSVGYNPPEHYAGPGDLAKLPVTTRSTLTRIGRDRLVREGTDLARCFTNRTSGSTGIPLRVYKSPQEKAVQVAKWLRVLMANGYSIRDKTMSFASPYRLEEGASAIQKIGLLRRKAINFVLPPEEQTNAFLDYQPQVLYGYRSLIDQIALELRLRGTTADCLKLLVATAEVITESSRRLSRGSFGTEVTESYGSEEMGVMAYETPARDGLHLCEDLTYFEFLNEDGEPASPGETGKVVVTDLSNTVMPFIRYDQGDLVVYEHADSRRSDSPRRLVHIIGREDDFVILPDGTRRTRYDFAPIHWREDVLQYRVVQKAPAQFQVLVVTDAQEFGQVQSDLLRRLEPRFPREIEFDIIQKERLEPDPSGKLRVLVSEVKTSALPSDTQGDSATLTGCRPVHPEKR